MGQGVSSGDIINPVMGILSNYKEVVSSRDRREVLLAMTSGQLLVQLSSMPVTLALPSVARHFDVSLQDAAWIIIVNLMVLGSTVFLGARLGDRYGHPRVFFVGTILVTVGAALVATGQSLEQVIVWRGLQGLGAGLIHGNGNAMLAYAFPAGERGRAYAFPITGSRLGTLIGLVAFGLFLEFFSWRLVFLAVVPIGLLAIRGSMPVLRQRQEVGSQSGIPIDYLGAVLLVVTATVFFLATVHAHGGEETFTSPAALTYHLPMTALFLALLGLFIVVERRVVNPFVEFRHFREKYFSLAITSNTMFHFSMLAGVYPGAPYDRRGQGTDAYLRDPGHAAPPVLRSVHADSGGKHPRQVRPKVSTPRLHGIHRPGIRFAGAICPVVIGVVHAAFVAADILGNQHLQHDKQRDSDVHPAFGTSRVCVGDAGDHQGFGTAPWGQRRQQPSWPWCCPSPLLP